MYPSIDFEEIISLSTLAGNAILEIYNKNEFSGSIDYKADHSPLTIADRIAHQILSNGLQSLYPDIPLISEEGNLPDFDIRKNWDFFWLVDPLDGTKEFIKRNGEFTVNIALIHLDTPVFGCIYVPVTGITYYGSKDEGAFKIAKGKTQRIGVSKKTEELTSIGSRSHGTDYEKEVLEKLPVAHTKTAGSSLKFCLVAEGAAEIYLREGPTMEWDTAAGQAIAESAGGRVTLLNGERFMYNKNSLLNPGFVCNGSGLNL